MESRKRKPLGGYLSPEAYDGWHTFAKLHGVTVTALLEVLGLYLAQMDRLNQIPIKRLLETARAVGNVRARRRKQPDSSD